MPNIFDAILVLCGVVQGIVKLSLWRPDVVFTKGGFVCLPVGIACKILGIPLVIHDSDAHPGLTNRILARWATAIATGAPLKHYPYPASISRYVGIPIAAEFKPCSDKKRRVLKKDLGFDDKYPLVVVTGGGLGAQRINTAVGSQLNTILSFTSVVLVSGTAQYDELRAMTPQDDPRFQLRDFVHGMADLFGAADIVVARAGATTILELAALAKPTVLIPNGFLTGGHQLKNAAAYAENGAVVVVDEPKMVDDPSTLTTSLRELLSNPEALRAMADKIHDFAKPNAAKDMADMILDAAK